MALDVPALNALGLGTARFGITDAFVEFASDDDFLLQDHSRVIRSDDGVGLGIVVAFVRPFDIVVVHAATLPRKDGAGIREWEWKPPGVRRRLSRVVFALSVMCTALFAHIAIDVAGDFVLAHDAYDDVAHHSRESIFTLAVCLALLALWRTLRAANAEVAGVTGALRAMLRAAVPASCARFVLGVAAAAIPALLAMSSLDALVDGSPGDDVADLLGGSIPLGLLCLFASATLVGTIVWNGVRTVARFERAILRLVKILAQRGRHANLALPTRLAPRPPARTAASARTRAIGLRAPPLWA